MKPSPVVALPLQLFKRTVDRARQRALFQGLLVGLVVGSYAVAFYFLHGRSSSRDDAGDVEAGSAGPLFPDCGDPDCPIHGRPLPH